jgi:hypothetical protein
MKSVYGVLLAAVVVLAAVAPSAMAQAESASGGFQGFLSGCCFGLRTGADYNDTGTGDRSFVSWFLVGLCIGPRTAMDYRDGKDFHWREILRIIPYVGIVGYIWDGIDIANGKGRTDLQQAYPGNYY